MKYNTLRDKIVQYKKDHPELGCQKIANALGCSKCSVQYYLRKDRYEFNARRRKQRKHNNYKCHPFSSKIHDFNKRYINRTFHLNTKDAVNKFGSNPICYLTGKQINIYDVSSYHFDHIVPISKNGTNSLDNLGICIKEANFAKRDLELKEFISLCKDIIKYHDSQNNTEDYSI